MCGLFGWVLGPKTDTRIARTLAGAMVPAAVRRGEHSHGWVLSRWAGSEGEWIRYRKTGTALRSVRKLFAERVVLGHTRHATHGAATKANAHPFHVTGKRAVYLAHNGVVHPEDYAEKYTVDSELIARRVADERPLTDLYGYGTIQWVYHDTQRAYVARISHDGDLVIADLVGRDKRHIASVWSSTREPIRTAAALLGCRATYYDTVVGTVYAPTTETGWIKTTHEPVKLGSFKYVPLDPRTLGIASSAPVPAPKTQVKAPERAPTINGHPYWCPGGTDDRKCVCGLEPHSKGTNEGLGNARNWPDWMRKYAEIKT